MIESKINVKAKNEFVFIKKFDVAQSYIKYSDDSDNSSIIRKYSVKIDDDWSTVKPISKLILENGVSELKLYIGNDSFDNTYFTIKLDNISSKVREYPTKEIEGFSPFNDFLITLGKSIVESKIQNNYQLNLHSLVEIRYYKTVPDKDSADFILNEFSLAKLEQEKCIRIITPNNRLPKDEESQHTEWGYEFNSFEAYFSSLYFESVFGRGERPIVGDYMTFLALERSYYISSTTRIEDINGILMGYKLALKHYEKNTSISNRNPESPIEKKPTSEEIYFPIIKEESSKQLNRDQNMESYIHDDEKRYLIGELTKIGIDTIGKFYYNEETEERESIIYNKPITSDKNFAISLMVKRNETELNFEQRLYSIGGLQLIIKENRKLSIKHKSLEYDTEFEILNSKWYHLLLNVYNNETLIEIVVVDNENKNRNITVFELSSKIELKDNIFAILNSDCNTARIRFWKKTLPREFEKRILNSNWVEKPEVCYIIDNVEESLNSRTMLRSRFTERNNGEIMNKIYSHTDLDSNFIELLRPKINTFENSIEDLNLWK